MAGKEGHIDIEREEADRLVALRNTISDRLMWLRHLSPEMNLYIGDLCIEAEQAKMEEPGTRALKNTNFKLAKLIDEKSAEIASLEGRIRGYEADCRGMTTRIHELERRIEVMTHDHENNKCFRRHLRRWMDERGYSNEGYILDE